MLFDAFATRWLYKNQTHGERTEGRRYCDYCEIITTKYKWTTYFAFLAYAHIIFDKDTPSSEEHENEIVSTSFSDFTPYFDKDSTELQKEAFFDDNYKGKYVTWSGTVSSVSESYGSYAVQVKHKSSTLISDVRVEMRITKGINYYNWKTRSGPQSDSTNRVCFLARSVVHCTMEKFISSKRSTTYFSKSSPFCSDSFSKMTLRIFLSFLNRPIVIPLLFL